MLEAKERGRGFIFAFKEQEAKDIRNNAEIIDRKVQGRINSLRRRSSFFKLNLYFIWILHESEVFICKAFKGEAIVYYAEPLITKQMEASGSPAG